MLTQITHIYENSYILINKKDTLMKRVAFIYIIVILFNRIQYFNRRQLDSPIFCIQSLVISHHGFWKTPVHTHERRRMNKAKIS